MLLQLVREDHSAGDEQIISECVRQPFRIVFPKISINFFLKVDSVIIASNKPRFKALMMRFEFDSGISKAYMNTFVSSKALILMFLKVLQVLL